jgi:hypothetical protein
MEVSLTALYITMVQAMKLKATMVMENINKDGAISTLLKPSYWMFVQILSSTSSNISLLWDWRDVLTNNILQFLVNR